jgi:hypothetical protein
MFARLYPFPRQQKETAKSEPSTEQNLSKAKIINLGRGHEQLGLFDLDKAA